jgi:hypothetical protein
VDNAFDDFLEIQRAAIPWPDGYKVSVALPLAQTPLGVAEVVIEDSGRGMDLDTLNNAVRAGWSSNDPFSKLGLFGMGFNVSTARLGRVARVLSSRAGDAEWIGVEIDLDTITDEFDVPVIREPKADVQGHGTKVQISRLDPARAGWFQRNQGALRTKLGDVYSYLFDDKRFELWVNGVRVKPRRACRWGDGRSVTYGSGSNAEEIPAVIPIDQLYPPAETCLRCHNWQERGKQTCTECGSNSLVQRERRIHGWLGIQRYLHKTDFGIDFFRNGRKILRYDKRLFEWENPNDPMAARAVEYPVELGQGGRIIGEIHLDHVPVHYQKDAFDWADRSWIAAVDFLRGSGPLLPQMAQRLNYPVNQSPLAHLHRGYRRNDPGYRYLVPGNKNGPIHEQTRDWAQKFYAGDAEYQTDQRWWDAVVFYEEQQKEPSDVDESNGEDTGSILEELGLGGTPRGVDGKGGSSSTANDLPNTGVARSTPSETEQERLDRYRAHATKDPGTSGEFGMVELGAAVNLTTYQVRGTAVTDGAGLRVPVLLTRGPGSTYDAFVDLEHPVFQHFAEDPSDLVMTELGLQLRTRADSTMPLSRIVAALKEQHLADRKVDYAVLAGQARELMRSVQERIAAAVNQNPDRAWQFLEADERVTTENNIVAENVALTLQQAQVSGEFILYTPAMFIPRLVEEWPEAFMDGKVFNGMYESLTSTTGWRLSVGKLVGYIYDVARLASVAKAPVKSELVRARYSLELLPIELAPEPAAVSAAS